MEQVFPELYTKGCRVWIPDTEEVWKNAIVKSAFDAASHQLLVEDADGNEITLKVQSIEKLPPLRNPDILLGSNDLTCLSYLHEPAVLHNLRLRFLDQQAIYTWCGIVLVAVNPFCELSIYGEETIQTYHQAMRSSAPQLDPHIYAVAEDAYAKLEREQRNQSIIVSGESGAGKTVTTKYAMRYFASVAGSRSTSIEQKVLALNPIMEAIGNARTVRNDNSSRFGKYIQIAFDIHSHQMAGGHMSTYLLEKSRIAFQGPQERNFHAFYQLRNHAQANPETLAYLQLHDQNTKFAYLGELQDSSPCGALDDVRPLLEALQVLNFGEKQQQVIFKVLAAILHAGNMRFEAVDEEQCCISESDEHLKVFCQLLALDEEAARKWFTQRVLRTGMREVIVTPVSQALAGYARDALAKYMYERMFHWIVGCINRNLAGGLQGVISSSLQFIGVLDIYGFEHFELNSFEQFCINYANEALQQQFNQHVFKLEQEEYVRENIDWTFISFTDNQPVINLIEAKPIGILNLLDEECKMPKGDDRSWCAKLYAQLPTGTCFKKPKFRAESSFIVQHFADQVLYQVEGFLEKNRDAVWEEQIDLLRRSTFLDCLFTEQSEETNVPASTSGKMKITPQKSIRTSKLAKATVGSQFRESLASLMSILNATTPHYVRCIKPNDMKGAFEFNNERAVQQLRACGVLETIRISSNGFPSRWTYADFANRYRVFLVGLARLTGMPTPVVSGHERKLLRTDVSKARQLCEQILDAIYERQLYGAQFKKQINGSSCVYQFGKTKIFFRAGQVALLERIRAQRLRDCAILLQRCVRGWLARRRYKRALHAIRRLQTLGRGLLARQQYQHMRQKRAATRIQSAWRAHVAKVRYTQLRNTALGLQRAARGYLARQRFTHLREHTAAICIQRHVRGWLARKQVKMYLQNLIKVQCAVRRWLALRQLKQLRIEARSIAHVQTLNKGLEGKIFQLQQRIERMKVELASSAAHAQTAQDVRTEKARLEHEARALKQQLVSTQQQVSLLQQQLDQHAAEASQLRRAAEEAKYGEQQLSARLAEVSAANSAEQIAVQVADREKVLAARYERERRILLEERESEKEAHQRLLRKYALLEERLEAARLRSFDDSDEDETEHPEDALEQAERIFAAHLDPTSETRSGSINGQTPDKEGARTRTRSGNLDLSTVSLMMRCSELEQERAKLKHENHEMREALADKVPARGATLLAAQCAQLQSELDRAREERSQLKTIVLGQECGRGAVAESEVVSAFKCIIRQLERELQTERAKQQELSNTDQLTEPLSAAHESFSSVGSNSAVSSGGSSSSGVGSFIGTQDQQQMMRLSQEKLLLQQKCDQLAEENNRLRLELLRRNVVGVGDENYFVGESGDQVNSKYFGMFEFTSANEPLLMKILVLDLEPSVALKFPPHYPTYIIFMCVRYCDYISDDHQIKSLLNNFLHALKRRIRHNHSLGVYALWLANTCAFITCFKQYSGDELFGVFEESLKNFDLREYRQIFTDLTVWIYHNLLRMCEDRIQPLIVPAILEYEGLATSGVYSQPAHLHRSGSAGNRIEQLDEYSAKPVELLVAELSDLFQLLRLHEVQPEIIFLIFKQLFYFICSGALNNLLLRKDLCHWDKAMQIRFNLSALEQWCREQQIPNCNEVIDKLDPITQATKLLQTRKSEDNIPTIEEMCNKLNSAQIVKILTLYTAGDEEDISPSFIKNLQTYIATHRQEDPENSSLLRDTKHTFPLTIPYKPSNIKFQNVTLPPVLLKQGLGTILKRI